jgi:flavodoxin I
MPNILIVYGSTTGNTEMVAEQISNQLSDHNPKMQDVTDTTPEELTQYDVIIAGASTWDDGLLQTDFRDFVEGLTVDLNSKKVAAFGLGDSNYPNFCKSAEILQETFTKLGTQSIVEPLKIDGFPDEEKNEQKVEQWCEQIKSQLS